MRILIANDDGIRSPALPRLAEWAKRRGEVTVVAPKVEQSGMSHAIDFTRVIEAKPVELIPGVRAYSLDSTPADCVRFAMLGLHENFDLILSGINRGFNLGKDIMYSGTVAAIFEGSRYGIPGIALSTDPTTFESAFEHLDEVFEFVTHHRLLMYNSLYNINIPLSPQGIRVTRQGSIYFSDGFIPQGNDLYTVEGAIDPSLTTEPDADVYAVHHDFISVTPLTAERTAMDVFRKLKNL